jgi:hypothetical protein
MGKECACENLVRVEWNGMEWNGNWEIEWKLSGAGDPPLALPLATT